MPPRGKTHAIVIGVGSYHHLNGGARDLAPSSVHSGMTQLSSPPESARAFADWLKNDYYNPDKPLDKKSMTVIISDERRQDAAMSKVKPAIRKWEALGNDNDLMIFYFSGHGLQSCDILLLLLSDYGEYKYAPLENTIGFNEFYLGMNKCKARYQCFFVDACRTSDRNLIGSASRKGDPIIEADADNSLHGDRHAPIYYSTLPGLSAYGPDNAPSFFTNALLESFKGAGTSDFEGHRGVYTHYLSGGLNFILQRNNPKIKQPSHADLRCCNFPIHFLPPGVKPIVPVSIRCEPQKATSKAELSYREVSSNNIISRQPPKKDDWHITVEEGQYDFMASFNPSVKKFRNNPGISKTITPQYKIVKIPVSKEGI